MLQDLLKNNKGQTAAQPQDELTTAAIFTQMQVIFQNLQDIQR